MFKYHIKQSLLIDVTHYKHKQTINTFKHYGYNCNKGVRNRNWNDWTELEDRTLCCSKYQVLQKSTNLFP